MRVMRNRRGEKVEGGEERRGRGRVTGEDGGGQRGPLPLTKCFLCVFRVSMSYLCNPTQDCPQCASTLTEESPFCIIPFP